MRVAVIGSRGWQDAEAIWRVLDAHPITALVSGGARGVDSIAAAWAKERGIQLTEFRPDYRRFGKGAPSRRNAVIVDLADEVLAFWDGRSPGTRQVIELGRNAGKVVHVFQPVS